MSLRDHPLYARLRTLARTNRHVYGIVRVLKYGPFRGLAPLGPRRRVVDPVIARGGRMLYLGSGGRKQPGMINLDITPTTGPDVVGDGFRLPFRPGTFDAIICEYVIEHVEDPEGFIRAATTALADDGYWYLEVPFLQPIHAEGWDYVRWTRKGFRAAAARCGLEIVEDGIHYAPAFTLHWVLKEWCALLLSLGWMPLRRALIWLFGWIFAPLLILDLIMPHLPGADDLVCGWWVIARKARPDPAQP